MGIKITPIQVPEEYDIIHLLRMYYILPLAGIVIV